MEGSGWLMMTLGRDKIAQTKIVALGTEDSAQGQEIFRRQNEHNLVADGRWRARGVKNHSGFSLSC